MSIEQHTGPDAASEPSGAALAHVLADLTRAVLDLPAGAPAAEPASERTPVGATDDTSHELTDEVPQLRAERRPGSLLHELSFLDD